MFPRPTPQTLRFGTMGSFVAGLGLSLASATALGQPASISLVDSAYLSAVDTGQLNPQQFTVEAKFRATGPGYGQTQDSVGATIVAKPSQGVSGGYIVAWSLSWSPQTNRVVFIVSHVFDVSGTVLYSNATIAMGATAHVAGTFDGAFLRLYVNGVLDSVAPAAQSGVYVRTIDPILIGAGNYSQGYTRRWQGMIDDVRVWDHARSGNEISDETMCQLTQGTHMGLLANWVFDGESTVDVTGNGHDAWPVPSGAQAFAAALSLTPPTFSFPGGQTICPEGTAMFAVSVLGSPPMWYQWQVNTGTAQTPQWCDLSDLQPGGGCMGNAGGGASHAAFNGSQSPTLSVSSLSPADARQYRCTVANACGPVTSLPALLTICGADFDCDGTLDFFDYDAFVVSFETGC